ncbi:hypothetical protein FGO68_gene978 [Halteria grandinella]|uniref:Uncharacterized protein n=1 Tax=Halteria grandinella TaxID=5974 RepID=A0A8J8T420_HALGN|nr:hypothetical protein FGO68_gene978 [Halteria grandinella]
MIIGEQIMKQINYRLLRSRQSLRIILKQRACQCKAQNLMGAIILTQLIQHNNLDYQKDICRLNHQSYAGTCVGFPSHCDLQVPSKMLEKQLTLVFNQT